MSVDGVGIFTSRTGWAPESTPIIGLLVGIDWRFILGLDLISLSPLPVIVAIVFDFLDCDRRFCRDVVWEVV